MARSVLRLLRPHRLEGAGKIRMGRMFDGGYVMIDRFDSVAAAYSIGVSDDASWDLDLAARGVPVFQYDHTIAAPVSGHPLLRWERLGLGHAPDPDGPLDTLANMIARNGHAADDDLILKCDIEGAEWRVLPFIAHGVLRRFSQIIVELHGLAGLHDVNMANTVHMAVLNLVASHRVVHVHGNNFSPWAAVGGVPIPDVIEVTLARLDLGRFTVSDESFPTPIDLPNNPDLPDLYLGRFAFD
jgi:hypothetical protein